MTQVILSKIGIFYLLLYGFALVGYVATPSPNILWMLIFPWSLAITSLSVTPTLVGLTTINGLMIYVMGALFDKQYKESQKSNFLLT